MATIQSSSASDAQLALSDMTLVPLDPSSNALNPSSDALEPLNISVQDARTVFDHLQEAIFICASDRTTIDVNEQVLRLFKITREEALRYRIDKEYATEESPVHLLPTLWNQALEGKHTTFDWPSQRLSDGALLNLEITLQKLILSDQVRVMVSVRDVTERKQVELEQRRLLSVIEATPDLVGMSDAKGQCIYLNKAGRGIVGLSEDEPANFQINETMSLKERQRFIDVALPEALKHGSYSCESSLINCVGEELPVSRVLIVHRDDTGAVDCLSTVMRDIRQAKAVEERLRDREQFLSSIYEGANVAIFVWDLAEGSAEELICSGWNPACEAATGLSAESVIGKTPYDVFGPAQGAAVVKNNLRCIVQNQSSSYEEKIMIEGEPTWWNTKLDPVQDSKGRVYRVVGTTTNITALKLNTIELEARSQRQAEQAAELAEALAKLRRTQAQIIQSEKMSSLGEMVAGIAHEINNPVNFIHANIQPASSYAEDLIALIKQYQREYPSPSSELEKMLEDLDFEFVKRDFLNLLSSMKVGTQRIREIVLSLRNFSRLDEAEVKAVDLQEGIDSTLVILAHRIKENAARQTVEIVKQYQPMPQVECYPSQLNQVVMNIVANAIDALSNQENPKIVIAAHATETHALITVSDNGSGMSETVRERVFDPFYTTKPVGKGTGMGLSISYQIITQKHGGNLSVCSAPGEGTTFTIEIPLKRETSS